MKANIASVYILIDDYIGATLVVIGFTDGLFLLVPLNAKVLSRNKADVEVCIFSSVYLIIHFVHVDVSWVPVIC